MFRPSRWFGWNRAGGGGSDGSPAGGRAGPIVNVQNPHSLEHLKTLHNLLEKNQTVSEQNRNLLVETLRQIAEILIWGDQNDSTVFDFFLEKNMLYFFLRIMKQKCGGYVCTQLLQTLNILFENIKNETSLYYLLSNNHVNSIIVHKFDFDDEEVMAYYISFLKTLSLKLNNHTIHFFFNEHTADFPLYTEAIKFFNHSEKMVRIAVRTLTLNVFRVRENAMLKFIRDCTAAPYFSNLSWFIGKHVVDIETSLASYIENRFSNANNFNVQNCLIRLEDLIAEHLDHLHYLNDILLLNIDDLNTVLSDNLLHRLIIPLYLHSFLAVLYSAATPTQSNGKLAELNIQGLVPAPSLSPTVSLFLLTQAYIIFSYGPLLNTLVNFVLRSSKIDIELNARRCEFTPPAKSLEDAIEQAISTTTGAVVASSSGSTSSEQSSPVASMKGTTTTSQPKPDQVQNHVQSYQPNHNSTNHHHHHQRTEPMETEEPTNGVLIMTIKNWPDCPFLIAMLSTLNTSLTSNSGSAVEAESSSGRTSRSRKDSVSDQVGRGTSDPLSKSCHSPIVTQSIVELSSLDDREILFTLSLIASVLSNKAIDSSYYRGVFVPPSSESSPTDSEATNSYCSALINSLLLIMRQCCSSNSSIRIVTFELAVYLFKRVVFYYHYLELVQSPCPKSLPIFLSDHQLAVLEQANEDAAHLLRQYFRSTDQSVFLDLFEQEAEIAQAAISGDEKDQLTKKRPGRIWSHSPNLSLEQLFMDSTLLLPPDEISPSYSDANFYLRLPMNENERIRYAIKVFFILRRLSCDVRGLGSAAEATEATENMSMPEKQTDFLSMLLDSTETMTYTLDQFLDLENSDLNSCSIRFFYPLNQNRLTDARRRPGNHYSAPGSRTDSPSIVSSSRKMSRFMVITAEHVLLIEPDVKHYGWGVIRFIARLQDIEFWSHGHAINQPTTPAIPRKEKDDQQSIYVYFRKYQLSSSMVGESSNYSRLSGQLGSIVIRFTFDDQIRCYAAKQHLTKAQSKVRDRKISAIVRLIDLNSYDSTTADASSKTATDAARPKSKTINHDQRKKLSHQHQHPLLSRSLAVPGGAVLSSGTSPPPESPFGTSSSASAKFDMLNKTKYAYPAKVKSSSSKVAGDGEIKRKKKLKNPKELLPDREDDGIPLNELSPKTVRRNTAPPPGNEHEVRTGQMECSGGSKEDSAEQMASEQASSNRKANQHETIDI